ncbi:MAG TPA: putative porin [Chthoniobacterales bacterium]
MTKTTSIMLAAAASLGLATSSLHAQDSGPLIDKLIEKGILTDQEGEELRAELIKDFTTNTSAGKLNISSALTEMKLSGDTRFRWQYDDQQSQVASGNHVSQRSRFRFRLRLNADFKFAGDWFAGVGLETGQAADSGNQTIDAGFSDSNIYISKWFLGKNVDDWGTFVIGKQKNPFYTTDLVWDADINPVGLTESVAFHKLFGGSPAEEAPVSYSKDSGYSKDGKTVATYTAEPSGPDWGGFELTLVAGQFIYNTDATFTNDPGYNEEYPRDKSNFPDSDASNDVYMFVQQLIASYKFNSKTSVTFAPGFMISNAGVLIGFNNETPFNDVLGSDGYYIGASRDLAVITAPGDFTFPLGPLKGKVYWDFAYNVNGEDRFYDVYNFFTSISPDGELRGYSDKDGIAWLVGLEVGAGKGAGAWTLFANYRETGVASVDPNLNDSDFALGRLNTRGFKFGATYGITDFVSLGVTGFVTWNLDENGFFGPVNSTAIENRNAVNTVQVDLNWKF